jgi:excisionase family DNA binding protein
MEKIIEDVKFYSVKDISKKLGLSTLTVRKYIRNKRLKAKKLGNAYVISEQNFLEFLEQLKK